MLKVKGDPAVEVVAGSEKGPLVADSQIQNILKIMESLKLLKEILPKEKRMRLTSRLERNRIVFQILYLKKIPTS